MLSHKASLRWTESSTFRMPKKDRVLTSRWTGLELTWETIRGSRLLLLLFLTFSALVANPEKITLHGGQPRSWSPEHGGNEKSLATPPSPPPPPAACSEKIKTKITRRIHMSKRYAGGGYVGPGPSRVRTRISTIRRLRRWVSLRKILRFRVR